MLDLESTAANNAMFGSFPLLYKLGRFLPMMKRAQAISDRLREYAEQSLERYRRVLENDPDYLNSFTLIIGHNLPPSQARSVSKLLSSPNSPALIIVRSAGFLAEFFIQFHEHDSSSTIC